MDVPEGDTQVRRCLWTGLDGPDLACNQMFWPSLAPVKSAVPIRSSCQTDAVSGPEMSEFEYLREVEARSRAVVDEAAREGWLAYFEEVEETNPLRSAVNELAERSGTITTKVTDVWTRRPTGRGCA